MNRQGVTLIEMLIVVAIIGVVLSISFPAMSAGLASIRLASASGSVASFLTSTMNQVERREQPEAIVVDPHENRSTSIPPLQAISPSGQTHHAPGHRH